MVHRDTRARRGEERDLVLGALGVNTGAAVYGAGRHVQLRARGRQPGAQGSRNLCPLLPSPTGRALKTRFWEQGATKQG
jgi:hypothetical protein